MRWTLWHDSVMPADERFVGSTGTDCHLPRPRAERTGNHNKRNAEHFIRIVEELFHCK